MADETQTEAEVPEDLAQPLEELGDLMLSPTQPIYGYSQVHERVFVTWFESRNTEDEFLFVADPMAIELTAEEAKDFNDLFMQQMDQMQALLEGFVQNRKDAHAMDDGAGLKVEIRLECPNCGAFKPDPNAACTFC